MYALTPTESLVAGQYFQPADVCGYLRVSVEQYTDQVEPLVLAAMAAAEDMTGAALFDREWELLTDCPESGYLPGPNGRGPLELKAGDAVVPDTQYRLVGDCLFMDELPRAEYYALLFRRGYPPERMPGSILQAVKVMVSDWYDNRSDGPRSLPTLSEKLLLPHRNLH